MCHPDIIYFQDVLDLNFVAMKLVDTHAHIYINEFSNDINEVITRAKEKGVSAILMPAIDSSTHPAMLQTGGGVSRISVSA